MTFLVAAASSVHSQSRSLAVPLAASGYDPSTPFADKSKSALLVQPAETEFTVHDSGGTRFETVLLSRNDYLQTFKLDLAMEVKKGLFSGEGAFSTKSRYRRSSHNMSWVFGATRTVKRAYSGDALSCLSEAGKALVTAIQASEAPGESFKRFTASAGTDFVTLTEHTLFVGVEYVFEARSAEALSQTQANLKTRFGSFAGRAAFEHLRQTSEYGLRASFHVVTNAGTDYVHRLRQAERTGSPPKSILLGSFDLKNADVSSLQEAALADLIHAKLTDAPVTRYQADSWQKALDLPVASTLNFELIRVSTLRDALDEMADARWHLETLGKLVSNLQVPEATRSVARALRSRLKKHIRKYQIFALMVAGSKSLEELSRAQASEPSQATQVSLSDVEFEGCVQFAGWQWRFDLSPERQGSKSYKGYLYPCPVVRILAPSLLRGLEIWDGRRRCVWRANESDLETIHSSGGITEGIRSLKIALREVSDGNYNPYPSRAAAEIGLKEKCRGRARQKDYVIRYSFKHSGSSRAIHIGNFVRPPM